MYRGDTLVNEPARRVSPPLLGTQGSTAKRRSYVMSYSKSKKWRYRKASCAQPQGLVECYIQTVHVNKQNKMMAFLFLCIALCLSSVKAEQCENCGTAFERIYVLEGEPVYLKCPPCFLENDEDHDIRYNFTWHKQGNSTLVTTERLSRTHVEQNMIQFYPARTEDAGFYECVKRNSTYCSTKLVELVVYKNDDGLCYSASSRLWPEAYESSSDQLTCPFLEDFVAQEQAQVMWYKECEPLIMDGDRLKAVGFKLVIQNVTKEDAGNYTCEISHEHNGELFKVSRAMNLAVNELIKKIPPVIIYPKNEKMYVKIGSPLMLACNVSYTGENFPTFWMVNNAYADDYFNSSRVIMEVAFSSTLPDGSQVSTCILNISEVKREDYDLKFICILQTTTFISEAYVLLQPPTSDILGPLIACFVTLAFVILIALVTYKLFKVDIVLCYRNSFRPLVSKKASDGKMYDAYVVFPKGNKANHIYLMDIFVLKVLPEVLERQCGYKLFIFGRDDLPGEAVANLIDESIKQSRRLIMILTGKSSREAILEDEFEQQIALYDALIHTKIKIILIEMENIDYTEMPESIKYIKQKQGTVKWKGDFTDESLSPNTRFWKKVRYRMPPAQDLSSSKELRSLPSA